MFLISCSHEVYCQGYEIATNQVYLVKADSFKEACEKIAKKFKEAGDFVNLTIL